MSDILIFSAFLAFVTFLALSRGRKYAAIAGWTALAIALILDFPEYLTLDNVLYPILAIISIPFLLITVRNLLREDPVMFQLSTAAAVGTLIYVPFTFIPLLRDALIANVVNQIVWLLHLLGHPAQVEGLNIIIRNGFATEIILACTGITAMAIMLGVVGGAKGLTFRQGLFAFFVVVPTIYILNILRVAVVFIAWSDQWFAFLPDPTGTTGFGAGYSSFFWAHNVFAEALSLIILVTIAYALFRLVPGLAEFAKDLALLYTRELETAVKKIIPPLRPGHAV